MPQLISAVFKFEVCDSDGNDRVAHIHATGLPSRTHPNTIGGFTLHILDPATSEEINVLSHEFQEIYTAVSSAWDAASRSPLNA